MYGEAKTKNGSKNRCSVELPPPSTLEKKWIIQINWKIMWKSDESVPRRRWGRKDGLMTRDQRLAQCRPKRSLWPSFLICSPFAQVLFFVLPPRAGIPSQTSTTGPRLLHFPWSSLRRGTCELWISKWPFPSFSIPSPPPHLRQWPISYRLTFTAANSLLGITPHSSGIWSQIRAGSAAPGSFDKKDKEQMAGFVIPSSFQLRAARPMWENVFFFHSPSFFPPCAQNTGHWIGPPHATQPVGMDLHKQMVRSFGAINALKVSVGTCLSWRRGHVVNEFADTHRRPPPPLSFPPFSERGQIPVKGNRMKEGGGREKLTHIMGTDFERLRVSLSISTFQELLNIYIT